MDEISQAIISCWENELHLEKITLESNVPCMPRIECYKFGENAYIRLSSFPCPPDDELHYCIEYAEDEQTAKNNVFDDAWLYGILLGKEQILLEMKRDLLAEMKL